MSTAPPPTSRILWLVDVVLLAGILAWVWPAVQQLPVGESAAAAFLDGPDAGEWALNAQMVARGDVASVDSHRMPTFLMALALVMGPLGGVAPAGHFISATSWALLPVVLYVLGRLTGGRLVGALAAAAVLGCGPLVLKAALFGVDPLLALLLPTSMAVAALSRRLAWPAALGAGLVAAMACCTHLMALPYVFPALLFALMPPPGDAGPSRVLLRLLAFGVGLIGLLVALDAVFDLISPRAFMLSVSEGIVRGTGTPDDAGLSDEARRQLELGSSKALLGASHTALLPYASVDRPWWVLVALLWAGIVGLGLRPGAPWSATPPAWLRARLGAAPSRRWRVLRRGWLGRAVRLQGLLASDAGGGLLVLSCLAPLPVLTAANAPERYSITLLPFVAVLLARGLGSGVAVVARFAPVRLRPWLVGVLGLPLLVLVGQESHARLQERVTSLPPTGSVPHFAWRLARATEQAVPDSSSVASPMREIPAHLNRAHCPRTTCTATRPEEWVPVCLAHLRRGCPSDETTPLVWMVRGPTGMGDDPASQALGAHAAATWGVAAKVDHGEYSAVVIAVPPEE